MRGARPYLLILALAALVRLPQLAGRPMHADEAILADKLGTLLEKGLWQYDPGDYHGPVLAYASVISCLAAGVRDYGGMTEAVLRMVPALAGLLLVFFPMVFAGVLGRRQALAACTLTALSPAMVYYSRFYIPEMVLVLLSAAAIATGYFYACRARLGLALLFGALLGLMFATKETAVIAGAAMLLAAAFVAKRKIPAWRHIAAAAAAAACVAAVLLGPQEALGSIAVYFRRALMEGRHVHPWYYYLRTLAPADGLVLAAGLAGLCFALRRAEQPLVRFLGLYTVILAGVYSLVPYKTPWCSLGFLHGLILLGGLAFDRLAGLVPRASRLPGAALAAICALYLGYAAFLTSHPYASDPRNGYAYAHTTRDVYFIRDRLEAFAAQHPDGRNVPVQIFGTQNLWPLPWYLRSFPRVEWWRGVREDATPAPVIIAVPDMEPALIHWLYTARPPGERHLYADLFARKVELRPGLELRGYARQDLWRPTAPAK